MAAGGSYIPGARPKRGALVLALCLLGVGAMLLDAQRRRDNRPASAMNDVVATTGLADLALNSSARWLRHPSQTEPGAPFADWPGALDTDPAGMLIGPPTEVLKVGATSLRRQR